MICYPPISHLAVSIEDMGDHWLASNNSDLGLAQLKFPKNNWDRDVISGVMLLAVQNERLSREDAIKKAKLAEILARPLGTRGLRGKRR